VSTIRKDRIVYDVLNARSKEAAAGVPLFKDAANREIDEARRLALENTKKWAHACVDLATRDATIAELRGMLEEVTRTAEYKSRLINTAMSELGDARLQVARLTEALAPFAVAGKYHDENPMRVGDNDSLWLWSKTNNNGDDIKITIGDVVRAYRVLTPPAARPADHVADVGNMIDPPVEVKP